MRPSLCVLLACVLLVLLCHSRKTLFNRLLLQLVALSCHSCLVRLHSRGVHEHSVNRDVHSGFDFDEISNLNVVVVNLELLALSEADDLVVGVADLGQLDKLFLLLVVVPGAD